MLLQTISTGLVFFLPGLISALYPNVDEAKDYCTMVSSSPLCLPSISSISLQILYIAMRWLSVLYPALIVWSIWGFLREGTLRSPVIAFTSGEEKSRTERKRSLFA